MYSRYNTKRVFDIFNVCYPSQIRKPEDSMLMDVLIPNDDGEYVLVPHAKFMELAQIHEDTVDALDDSINKCNELTELVAKLKHENRSLMRQLQGDLC
jgi:hypothetical protein